MSINKLEIITASNERFLMTKLEESHETVKEGCIVMSMFNDNYCSEYLLACGIPLKPGDAGKKSFKEFKEEIRKLGLNSNIYVQGW